MPVLPTMQSDDVRQENMAAVNIAHFWQLNATKGSDLSTQELQNSRFPWQFILRKETWLMTTYDTSQCPEVILPTIWTVGVHEWGSFTVLLKTGLSLHLHWRHKLLEIRLQKMRSSMYRLIKIFNIYFSLMYTGKPISSKHYKIRVSDPSTVSCE